ncbi:hypothetical protein [Streptosporangium carneum]|uniref:Uncharacterized protein n=1 Tax=Streptosporangium carneum TaxID=47481 RepID=A0A9W6HXN6_9ACTN|nr:hypothetical protein [Streptosporangium carneum]GLK07295.1 hypothetical protein GCM10017600_07000 [Streptosporangium carneum]
MTEFPEIPPEREERTDHLLAHAAHTLTHVAKVLARIGIRIPLDVEDSDTLTDALERTLDLIDDRPEAPEQAKGAIFALTLRWLIAMDMVAAYRMMGRDWREAAALDTLKQVEMLTIIALNLLDGRDSLN